MSKGRRIRTERPKRRKNRVEKMSRRDFDLVFHAGLMHHADPQAVLSLGKGLFVII